MQKGYRLKFIVSVRLCCNKRRLSNVDIALSRFISCKFTGLKLQSATPVLPEYVDSDAL
jgi:hypothetical protein